MVRDFLAFHPIKKRYCWHLAQSFSDLKSCFLFFYLLYFIFMCNITFCNKLYTLDVSLPQNDGEKKLLLSETE